MLVTALVFLCLVTAALWGLWIALSWAGAFTAKRYVPGLVYEVAGRTYQVPPGLSMRGKHQPLLLRDEIIERLRELYQRTTSLLDGSGIQWWLSGGTLLGVVRQGTLPMHFDDDIDLHIRLEQKPRLAAFNVEEEKAAGICRVPLPGPDQTRLSTATRYRLLEHRVPVLDIFYVQEEQDGGQQVQKLDRLLPTPVRNKKEDWHRDDLFPLPPRRIVDGLEVQLPARPENVLKQQYGQSCLNEIMGRSIAFAHILPSLLFFPAMEATVRCEEGEDEATTTTKKKEKLERRKERQERRKEKAVKFMQQADLLLYGGHLIKI